MATEIPRERILANFKPSKAKQLQVKTRDDHDDRDGNSKAHLACIRKLPCCVCLKMPGGEAHHLKATGQRGMGMRSPDKEAVPMCNDCHINGVERAGSKNELAWFEKRGIQALDLAKALWDSTGDVPKMVRIVLAQRG